MATFCKTKNSMRLSASYPRVTGQQTVFVDDYERHAAERRQELREFQDEFVAIEHLLLALLSTKDKVSSIMKDAGFGRASLIKALRNCGAEQSYRSKCRSKI